MSVRTELWKVKASRFVRGGLRRFKERFSGSNAGSPENIFGEEIVSNDEEERARKLKSTSIVFASCAAMGVSHAIAAGVKLEVKTGRKGIFGTGLVVGTIGALIWYNYVEAASDEVSEEDIQMMFEMMDNTGLGSYTEHSDAAKSLDILHTVVTGKTMDIGDISSDGFDSADDDEDEDDFDDGDGDPFSQDKKKSKSKSKPSKSDDEPVIGRTTKRAAGAYRRSFIPTGETEVEDEIESNKEETAPEGWLEIK